MATPYPEPIKVGDVVRLKSGGPAMTVLEIRNDGKHLRCAFFDEATGMDTEIFPPAALVKTPPLRV